MASSNPSLRLKLRPDLAQGFPKYAAAYGLGPAAALALLVWNDHVRPDRALAQVGMPAKLVRIPLTCSLRRTHRVLARRRAREQQLSLNAYLEAVIAAAIAQPGDLVVLASRR